jgi:serine protease AprX
MSQQFLAMRKLAPGLEQMNLQARSDKICQVMIETAGFRTERIWSFVEANQGRLEQEIKLIPIVTATLPTALLPELVRLAPVVKVWENTQVKILAEERPLPVYNGILAGEYRYTGEGVTIAVLDTGIAPHEDLIYPENRILAWNDLVGAQTAPYDDHGHGTHVAGLIAGNGRASRGRYKGVAPGARLVGLKVLDNFGCGRLSDLILGIEWCLGNRAALRIRIINLSLGTRSQSNYEHDPLCRAVALAWKKGIVICAAAGKTGLAYRDTDSPGGNQQIITVGNVNYQKPLTTNDERLQQWRKPAGVAPNFIIPDLVASGTNVVAVKRDGGYCTYNGASAAVSLVSGGAALVLERWPGLQPVQVKRLLKQKAGNAGLGRQLQGAGLLNLDRIFGVKGRRTTAPSNASNQLGKLFWKGLFNLFSKKTDRTPLKLNDILMVALPLVNQFLSGKAG